MKQQKISVFEVPESIQSKVDEIMSGSRSRFGHGVWFMGPDDDGDGDDGDDGDGDGDDSGDGDDEGLLGGDDGDSGDGDADVDAIVDKVVKALEGKFDSIADRRVNAILKEVRSGKKPPAKAPAKDDDDSAAAPAGPAAGDVREARLAYREYVGDEIKFLGTVEREHAMMLAQGLLLGRLSDGDDPETAGREVAKAVAASTKDLRKHYEKLTVAALKRNGRLVEDGSGPGRQPTNGGRKPGAVSGWKAGESTAQRLLGDRMPAANQQA